MEFGKPFEALCEEYLEYLYRLVGQNYSDCADTDALVLDTLTTLFMRMARGEEVAHPRAFLSAVMRNKHNALLRERYRDRFIEYTDSIPSPESEEAEETERRTEEHEAVRREIGRLARIYREVTVRHYVHGQSVEKIAVELGIPRGTVLSRLSTARKQIREGMEDMEKYSKISYEPKTATISIWGSCGLNREPFSLLHSDIEANVLALAYENPVSIRGIADTMGMPSAYIEPIIDGLIRGELMGQTAGGLVYTRCFVQRYEDSFGDIAAQERLAKKLASLVFGIVWRHIEPLTRREHFSAMTEKQKATFLLFIINQALSRVIQACNPDGALQQAQPPERPNAGRWLATMTISDRDKKRDNKYNSSGPVFVTYSSANDGNFDCQMFDLQSLFGDAHWAYGRFKYKCGLPSILRFYASLLPCDVKPDTERIYELIPELEELGILRRNAAGEVALDIPALPFREVTEYWNPACEKIEQELCESIGEDLKKLWLRTKNRVPKHVDMAECFVHAGAMNVYAKAQLLAIVEGGLLPYPVTIGRTPIIFVAYRERGT